jgi:hypothetical protein
MGLQRTYDWNIRLESHRIGHVRVVGFTLSCTSDGLNVSVRRCFATHNISWSGMGLQMTYVDHKAGIHRSLHIKVVGITLSCKSDG